MEINDFDIFRLQLMNHILCEEDDCKQMKTRGSRFCYAHHKEKTMAGFSLKIKDSDYYRDEYESWILEKV